ncbi:unnamed protein product [Prunus armeniaca]|uniref:Legume lectin domain-containing protein n=1 Tax=Prunus armeniaca TaxID=36596 RepID=A0A6J5V699_PRUAR|nr:unnamed protein product [Prunus armeniaca]
MIAMFFKLLILTLASLAAAEDVNFTNNGFRSANLSLDGSAQFTSNGLLMVTNDTEEQKGHAFYPNPVTFKNSYSNSNVFSFSTIFVFAVRSVSATLGGHGMAFVIAPKRGFPGAYGGPFLGLFNRTNNGNPTNHVFAVELDTVRSASFNDIDNNHVGIDINGLNWTGFASAAYYAKKNGGLRN